MRASFAPLPMFLLYIYASSRTIAAMDEMRRLIELKALAFAFPASLALLMTLGLLERADVLSTDRLRYRHIWLIVPFFYYLGLWIAKRRYR